MHQNPDEEIVDGEVVDLSEATPAEGLLEILPDGRGFLRDQTLKRKPSDIYVASSQIRHIGLRTGDVVSGLVRPPRKGKELYASLLRVTGVNNGPPEAVRGRPNFHDLTSVHPHQRYDLSGPRCGKGARLMDLIAPFGQGQRGLLICRPKGGKTELLIQIANGISEHYPNTHLTVALIGERPEEVTDMKRRTDAEVLSADFDAPDEHKVRVARFALERAKRLAEMRRHVVILWDGITRTVSALHGTVVSSGRLLSGGVDPAALQAAKVMFGVARALDEGGSVAILATCLIDTGSKMHEVTFEEFKGGGNMDVFLDPRLADKGIFPSHNIFTSNTRRDELLLTEEMRAWREILLTCLSRSTWTKFEWRRREILHETMDLYSTWAGVGMSLVEQVLRSHPGGFEALYGSLPSYARSVLSQEVTKRVAEQKKAKKGS